MGICQSLRGKRPKIFNEQISIEANQSVLKNDQENNQKQDNTNDQQLQIQQENEQNMNMRQTQRTQTSNLITKNMDFKDILEKALIKQAYLIQKYQYVGNSDSLIEDNFNLNIIEYLGGGAFGSVFKCYDQIRQDYYALKIRNVTFDEDDLIAMYKDKAEEIITNSLIAETDSKYSGQMVAFELSRDSNSSSSFGNKILMECGYCTLNDLKMVKKQEWTEDEVLTIIKQVTQGLLDMKRINLIHLDIKLQNIVLNSQINGIKLIDYGVSQKISDPSKAILDTSGTPGYWAPEMEKAVQEDRNHLETEYPYKQDIYSVGITIKQLLKSKYNNKPNVEKLVQLMLKENPSERISLEDIMTYLSKITFTDSLTITTEQKNLLDSRRLKNLSSLVSINKNQELEEIQNKYTQFQEICKIYEKFVSKKESVRDFYTFQMQYLEQIDEEDCTITHQKMKINLDAYYGTYLMNNSSQFEALNYMQSSYNQYMKFIGNQGRFEDELYYQIVINYYQCMTKIDKFSRSFEFEMRQIIEALKNKKEQIKKDLESQPALKKDKVMERQLKILKTQYYQNRAYQEISYVQSIREMQIEGTQARGGVMSRTVHKQNPYEQTFNKCVIVLEELQKIIKEIEEDFGVNCQSYVNAVSTQIQTFLDVTLFKYQENSQYYQQNQENPKLSLLEHENKLQIILRINQSLFDKNHVSNIKLFQLFKEIYIRKGNQELVKENILKGMKLICSNKVEFYEETGQFLLNYQRFNCTLSIKLQELFEYLKTFIKNEQEILESFQRICFTKLINQKILIQSFASTFGNVFQEILLSEFGNDLGFFNSRKQNMDDAQLNKTFQSKPLQIKQFLTYNYTYGNQYLEKTENIITQYIEQLNNDNRQEISEYVIILLCLVFVKYKKQNDPNQKNEINKVFEEIEELQEQLTYNVFYPIDVSKLLEQLNGIIQSNILFQEHIIALKNFKKKFVKTIKDYIDFQFEELGTFIRVTDPNEYIEEIKNQVFNLACLIIGTEFVEKNKQMQLELIKLFIESFKILEQIDLRECSKFYKKILESIDAYGQQTEEIIAILGLMTLGVDIKISLQSQQYDSIKEQIQQYYTLLNNTINLNIKNYSYNFAQILEDSLNIPDYQQDFIQLICFSMNNYIKNPAFLIIFSPEEISKYEDSDELEKQIYEYINQGQLQQKI